MTGLRYTLAVRHPDSGAATALLAGTAVPDWATDLVHPDDLEAEEKAKELTVPELEAEIASRNEGRDEADLIKPQSGKKADLLAALSADDGNTE